MPAVTAVWGDFSLDNPEVLIIAKDADALALEVDRLSEDAIPRRVCNSGEQALEAYRGQRVLFGEPDLIAGQMAKMPAVEWVQSTWAGVTPLFDSGRSDFVLTGVKGVFGQQMSEYVLGYILAHELRIFERAAEQARHRWSAENSGTLRGKTIGIMGTGSIGAHIASVLQDFNTEVRGLNRRGAAVMGFDRVLPVARLHEFLHDLDYVISVLPATESTGRLLNAAALAQLPRHACLINVGRSNVLDIGALTSALYGGALAGAIIDVFETEPLPPDDPLWTVPNLKITAHVAAHSDASQMAAIFVRNYGHFTHSEPMEFVVDFVAGY